MLLFLFTLLLGPRFGIVIWWLINPGRWDRAFDTWVWPVLGFVFAPWTTLTFVLVAPTGTVAGYDWLWLGLALLVDVSSWVSSFTKGRSAAATYPHYY